MENDLCLSAVDAVLRAESSFCKFLSANDSGETGGHQSGILISMTAAETCFSKEEIWNNHIMKRQINIIWQNDFSTESVLTWYESKKEILINLSNTIKEMREMRKENRSSNKKGKKGKRR